MLLPTRLWSLKGDVLKDAHRLIFQVNAPMKAGTFDWTFGALSVITSNITAIHSRFLFLFCCFSSFFPRILYWCNLGTGGLAHWLARAIQATRPRDD